MGIEIYDKAAVILKDDVVYYLVKYGSKNCSTMAYQTVIGDDFRNRYLTRETRDSGWSVIAYGTPEHHRAGMIGFTYWNAPTSSVYGQIRFGNKLNIALYLAKQTPVPFETFDNIQQWNIGRIIDRMDKTWAIDLADIPQDKKVKSLVHYCGTDFSLIDTCREYKRSLYWALDNL